MNTPRRLLLPTVITSLLASGALYAQGNDEDDEGTIEEVIVTGSRIRQDALQMATPVQFLSEDDIERSGATSLGDFLQELPISGSAINRTNNSSGNLGFPPDGSGIGAGASQVDLRYLQAKRTLVLVDGRRWVRGSSASGVSGAVDLNTIPAGAIKSIEILQDGASAIYGSDAIGGVVNVITRDDYDVFELNAFYSEFDEGDGASKEFEIAWGASSDVARAFLDISFVDQEGVDAGDRDISAVAIPGAPFPGGSSFTPNGRFVFTDPRTGNTVDVSPTGTFPTFDPNNPASGDFVPFSNDIRFNYQPFNFILTPSKRVNVFGKGEYDITDNTTFRLLASYTNRESDSRAAPEPLPFDATTVFGATTFWPADHPFNPFGVDIGPGNLAFIGRRPVEGGPRLFNQNVDTFYVSAGADGNFGGVTWDATAAWAQNQADQVKNGAFNLRNLVLGLGPVEDCAAVPGCVPVNIVGEGSLTPEMLNFVTFIQKDKSEQTLFDFTVNVTGEFGGLEAGDIGWALGYEFREEDGFFIPDSRVTSGESAGIPASPTDGGFEVDELYGEIVVPLLADMQGADRLDVNAAFRWSDYDLFDSDTVGKFGINWAPTQNFLVRANFSEGFRAPHIGELFNTGTRFDSSLVDPCSNATGQIAANCAQLGVPPGFEQRNPQLSVSTGGNVNLEPETADTLTVGFAWDVAAVDNWDGIDRLTIEATYYDIEIEDAIQPPNAQDLLNGCANTLDPLFCNAISRDATGEVIRVNGILTNIGGIETSGVDLTVNLDTAEYSWGRLGFQWVSTFLDDYTEITRGPDGPVSTDRTGTELGSPERGFVETKTTLHTNWYKGDWDVRFSIRYLSELDEPCGGLGAALGLPLDSLCTNGAAGNELGDTTYVDAQVRWAPSDFGDGRWEFQFGAENLFDEDPPLCRTCDLNSWDGTLYPVPGRVFYGRVSYSLD